MMFNAHTHSDTNSSFEIVNFDFSKFPSNYFSIGIHPWFSDNKELSEWFDHKNMSNPKLIAIGEIGLDKLKGPTLEIQKNTFISQIKISEGYKLPVILHCVKAWEEVKKIRKDLLPTQFWIYHGFTKINILEEVIREGMFVSIGSQILTNDHLQKALLTIPDDQLFLETDDSEITINEVYDKVAALKNISLQRLETILFNNLIKVFPKWSTGLSEQNF